MAVNQKLGTRNAQRSRAAILEAAEQTFAARGFHGASLADIAALAGVSRGTPSYFFGSKEALYLSMLERVFRDRQAAASLAFEPLVDWARKGGTHAELRAALVHAVDGYLSFLLARPTFVRLLQHEDLAGGDHLAGTPRERNAMAVSFDGLRRVATERGLKKFDVDIAVLLFVSLTFSPLTQRSTFMAVLGYDLTRPTTRQSHVEFVTDQLLYLIHGCAL